MGMFKMLIFYHKQGQNRKILACSEIIKFPIQK